MASVIIGADLALNHGSIVTSEGEVLYYYTTGDGMRSDAKSLALLADVLVSYTPPGSIVAIDWDRKAGLWGGGRSPEVAGLITMLVSFYGAVIAERLGCQVYYITPALVRSCLGLRADASKGLVHYNIEELVPASLSNDVNGDNYDAWILTHVWHCAKEKHS